MLTDIFLEVARRVDGARVVSDALTADALLGGAKGVHVLALGKVAFPMLSGFLATSRETATTVARGLVVAPHGRFQAEGGAPPIALPAGIEVVASDHPTPSTRSVAAGIAARAFVGSLRPEDHLVVLISGGGSALLCAPAGDLTLDEKRATVVGVARAGATIHELNCVRKHLSAVKGGQLALLTRARTTVLALSDVVGNDPGTIASGPFSPDSTTFAEALALTRRFYPDTPAAARAWLARGAAGEIPDTPKPGDARLERVDYRVVADPSRVAAEARDIILASGRQAGVLCRDTELDVNALATAYGERARTEAGFGGPDRILVGNGEPSIVVSGNGRGGRATHLALLVAREISGVSNCTFLAAGTDDRDGNSDVSGAVIDGTTWARAESAGLDPGGALARCDSASVLGALGCQVEGPGTSNLLDLHLLHLEHGPAKAHP
jgi:hydroxypyruvate reductase